MGHKQTSDLSRPCLSGLGWKVRPQHLESLLEHPTEEWGLPGVGQTDGGASGRAGDKDGGQKDKQSIVSKTSNMCIHLFKFSK